MRKIIHIFNGDALKEHFPNGIKGEQIVARECLVDGPVSGDTLDELLVVRSQFLSESYGESSESYGQHVVPEFQKIADIKDNTDIHLWFEDDLFCQVNCWFVLHILMQNDLKNCSIFLVRPQQHTQYGFAGLNEEELFEIFQKKTLVENPEKIAELWTSYQKGDLDGLKESGEMLKGSYPFILTAIDAHIDRFPNDGQLGRPKESLKTIVQELNTHEFGPVFAEFCKRESVYGFGDLQVKRLFDELLE